MKRKIVAINTGSMADIAFLLIIFFLLATTIKLDQGIRHRLPAITDEAPSEVDHRNIFELILNQENELLIERKKSNLSDLKDQTIKFILNYGKDENLSRSPRKAVISVTHDEDASYDTYIQVQNEIKKAFVFIRNDLALDLTDGRYNFEKLKTCQSSFNKETSPKEKKACKSKLEEIIQEIPMKIVEKNVKL